jgi:hypothetical protein
LSLPFSAHFFSCKSASAQKEMLVRENNLLRKKTRVITKKKMRHDGGAVVAHAEELQLEGEAGG